MKRITENLEKCVEDLIRYDKDDSVEIIVKQVFETILKHERSDFLNSCSEKNKGNGFYERTLKSLNKYFQISIPRDRMGLFKPVFLELLKKQETQIQDLAFKLYVKGLTTRDIEQIFLDVYGKKMSPTSVSNITKEFGSSREAWLKRKINKDYYFIFIDAVWISIRRDQVAKEAFYIAVGLNKELKREILGVYNIPIESAEGWRSVFNDLKIRGLQKVAAVIADGISGIDNIISEELPGTLLQTCIVHKLRRILLKVRASDKEEVNNDFKKVFVLEDPNYKFEQAKENLDTFINKWNKIYPYFYRHFENLPYENYFTYLRFPYLIHRMIYTTNWIERLNKDIKRTVKMRNSFPTPDSAMNLICAYLIDYERRVYQFPVTAFLKVKDTLNNIMDELSRTHNY